MKTLLPLIMACILLLPACRPAAAPPPAAPTLVATIFIPSPTVKPKPSQTSTVTAVPPTATVAPTPTEAYPLVGRGPTGFAANVDPLTGLEAKDPALLERRPIIIKVENIPRAHRPQWGLSMADLVYEYYTEFGATRFAAVFYGSDAQRVGPIRSGRFFDANLIKMYKSIFVYGSAWSGVQERFFNSDFYNRLILETNKSCPALCRYDPNGQNLLVADTVTLQDYLASLEVDNTRQNLDGMFFRLAPAAGGEPASQVYLRYSGEVYNRWDYDQASGRYLRFADKQDDVNRNNEAYDQLTDRLTGLPISVDNLVTLCVPHQWVVKKPDSEVLDILMDPSGASYTGCDGQPYRGGTGAAYAARDGKMYKVTWQRAQSDSVLALFNPDGTPFPLKPGQTWYEVLGASSRVQQEAEGAWRFTFVIAP